MIILLGNRPMKCMTCGKRQADLRINTFLFCETCVVEGMSCFAIEKEKSREKEFITGSSHPD